MGIIDAKDCHSCTGMNKEISMVFSDITVNCLKSGAMSSVHGKRQRLRNLSRIHDSADEQNATGLVVADEEKEWMIGSKYLSSPKEVISGKAQHGWPSEMIAMR